MTSSTLKMVPCMFLFVVSLLSEKAFAMYTEGVDTTDINGYNKDSTFRITTGNGIQSTIKAAEPVRYFQQDGDGYFKYIFDEIKMAPDHPKDVHLHTFSPQLVSYCFVIKKTKDSTYTKVQILEKLTDNRFTFKYGANSTPNDRVLEKPDYDRSVLYKPNNVYHKFYYMGEYPDTVSWDPPLPNNNHLIGYIYYSTQRSITIDTTAPINPVQWDSIAFVDSSTNFISFIGHGGWYYNVVAVYAEGKSDFLQGWTNNYYSAVGTNKNSLQPVIQSVKIELVKTATALIIALPTLFKKNSVSSINIYNSDGRQIERFPNVKNNRVIWNSSKTGSKAGVYIAKAQLSDKSTISRTFMITR